MTEPTIVLIGAGNLATQLGASLLRSGYRISQVYSRTTKNANSLAKKLKAHSINDLKKIDTTAAIYIIAVKDDAIATVAQQLKLKDAIVVHTSGSVDMNVLKGSSKNIGVFYPLQTFSKSKAVSFKNIPVCVEGNNKTTEESLLYFAKSISKKAVKINSAQRQQLHLAAVFACNFSNHVYSIAADLLKKNKMELDLLKPLIMETTEKIMEHEPAKMQTGPAMRGDKNTIDKHLSLLKETRSYQDIYKLLSNSIAQTAKKNKS
ncbi:MAG: DUF2520 domain-containing protein [Bacteroidia bacterium]|nr:DUF2520 domain-containing protein [Bacteroidia bacterium]